MDVLSYTAFNQQVEYQKSIREKEACYRTLVNEKVAQIGGGGGSAASASGQSASGGAGGSGIVIIRYRFQ